MGDGWSSKGAFVLASIGAAVGLGNIWRFPYIASGNGGLWFLVPYFICLVLVGIPLFMLEAGQGFISKKGFFKAVEGSAGMPLVRRGWRRVAGIFPVLVSTVILGYYAALCSWTLWFAAQFLLGNNPSFAAMQQGPGTIVAFIIVFASAYLIAMRGISRGIEPVTGYLVPLLFVFLLALFAYSLTLQGALSHLERALLGGPQSMLEPKAWYYALSQVLFSLSVGYGIMFTYGLHLKKGGQIFASAFQVAGADTAASLLAFSSVLIIGGVAGAQASGIALSFEALPAFFANEGLLGMAAGGAFFVLLFCAAFTSVLSMIEHTRKSTQFLRTGGRLAVACSVFLIGMGSVLSYTPLGLEAFGKPVLDLLDFVFGTFLAPFSALAVALCCAYLLPHRNIARRIGVPAQYAGLFALAAGKIVPLAIIALIIFSQMSGLY